MKLKIKELANAGKLLDNEKIYDDLVKRGVSFIAISKKINRSQATVTRALRNGDRPAALFRIFNFYFDSTEAKKFYKNLNKNDKSNLENLESSTPD